MIHSTVLLKIKIKMEWIESMKQFFMEWNIGTEWNMTMMEIKGEIKVCRIQWIREIKDPSMEFTKKVIDSEWLMPYYWIEFNKILLVKKLKEKFKKTNQIIIGKEIAMDLIIGAI